MPVKVLLADPSVSWPAPDLLRPPVVPTSGPANVRSPKACTMNSRLEAVVSSAEALVKPVLPAKASRPPLSSVRATPPIIVTPPPEFRRSELTESAPARGSALTS